MRNWGPVVAAIAVMALLGLVAGGAGAQSPTPAPLVITATPIPQVIVVTATPIAPPEPTTFWGEYGDDVVVGLIGLIMGGVLVWVLQPAFQRLGNALAERLSRLGAGRSFLRWYRNYLVDEYRCLNIRGLRTRAPVSIELEQVYVSLRAEVPGAELESATARRGFTIGQVMGRERRLAIVGGPGCGKTTLLAYLALTYARDQAPERLGLEKERLLPILVPLRLLRTVLAPADEDAPTTLPQYLDARFKELGRQPPPGFFDQRLRDGECLVLLDGLDEVADERERRQMAVWVDRLVSTYPRNRYVVTSRPAGYDSAPLENDFTRYEVRDFEMAEVEQFVRSWYLAVETATTGDTDKARRDATQRAGELIAAIRASAGIRRLVFNPLLLSIVALVHRYRAHLPDRRVDLYNECVEVLLGHWDTAKGLVGQLAPAQKRAVLQFLALTMHEDEVRQLPRAEVEMNIAACLPRVTGGEPGPGDVQLFLDEVRERSGLLVEQEMGAYAFSHLTFQEYLAACQIAASKYERERAALVERATSEWWREVLLLYAGMCDPSPMVLALLERDWKQRKARQVDRAPLLLAGECLAEAVEMEPQLRQAVERELEGLFAAEAEPRAYLRAGRVLARLKGDDGLDYFLRLMDEGQEQTRTAAALAVGQMGREGDAVLLERLLQQLVALAPEKNRWRGVGLALREVDDRLLEILTDPDAPPTLQDAAAAALDWLLVEVPAGEFTMGSEEYHDEKPVHKVYVDTFYIARYPVTNAQWARFVAATGRKPPQHWPDGACPADKATHPVVNVSWHDARAYAAWAGVQLLSEAQWEKAARGADGRRYPWGDEFDKDKCNTSESGIADTAPVGRYSPHGDSPYGVADMAGNVWEWTSSLYKGYPYRADDGREDAEVSGDRVLRGGSFVSRGGNARSACRDGYFPYNLVRSVGVRVGVAAPFSPPSGL